MKLQKYSRNRLMETFAQWHVPKDFADPMYNYLVHGFDPGSFFRSVLANDFVGAIRRSHPSNTLEAKKALAGWIVDTVPFEARGDYVKVDNWCKLSEDERRATLEKHNLVFSTEDEAIMILSGTPTTEPFLY